jgi:hypothetical protein
MLARRRPRRKDIATTAPLSAPAIADPVPTPRALARTAGALYLAIIVRGLWSEIGVRQAVLVPGDPAATAAAIAESSGIWPPPFASSRRP